MAVDNRGDGGLESMPDVGEVAGMLGSYAKLEPYGRRTCLGRDREVKLNGRISPLGGLIEIPIRGDRDDRVGLPGVGEFVALELSQRVENVSHVPYLPQAARALQPVRQIGRDGEIRTRDPLNPIQVRYQAALRPVPWRVVLVAASGGTEVPPS